MTDAIGKTMCPKRFARQPAEASSSTAKTAHPKAEASSPTLAKAKKTDLVLALFRRVKGATLTEITEATGVDGAALLETGAIPAR